MTKSNNGEIDDQVSIWISNNGTQTIKDTRSPLGPFFLTSSPKHIPLQLTPIPNQNPQMAIQYYSFFKFLNFIEFKQQIQYMKTRSHIASSKTHTPNEDNAVLCEEKEVFALSRPRKRQKSQNGSTLGRNQNGYDLIPFVPTIQLTVADMKGSSLPLLARLQTQYSHFGAVKLVCPAEWSPPMEFKRPLNALTTRIQPLHQLRLGKSFEEKKQAYSLVNFHDLASDFERRYCMKFSEQGESKTSQLENQYWRLVEGVDAETQALSPKRYRVTVEYAADLPANKYGSGFPTTSCNRSRDGHFDYALNSFNLNNIYRSAGSLLSISQQRGQFIGGITTPWVYVAMMFSSFCWHVEDSAINSINYSHCGASKVWYVIGGQDKEKFDAFVEQRYGDRQVVKKITYMIDPLELVRNGIRVYKVHQRPREFVCTFFKAYHCGFSEGFNIGEAVNFVIPESLPLIRASLKTSTKPSLFCYEWLIYENHVSGVRLGAVSNVIREEYQSLLALQQKNLKKIWGKVKKGKVVYVQDKVKYTRHVCAICKNYLYLSFASCLQCNKDYCFSHTEKCCPEGLTLSLRTPNSERQVYIDKLLKS